MHKQRGLTLSGLIVVLVLLSIALLFVFKIAPVLIEYQTIQKQFRSMAEDPSLKNASRAAYERAFVNRAIVDDIKNLKAEDLEITKEGDTPVISGNYSVKVPLFWNVSACFDFTPSSR